MRTRLSADVGAGLIFIVFGALFLWEGAGLSVGSASRMGAGYLPRILCVLLVITGAVLLYRGARGVVDESVPVPVRPLIFIPLSLLVFSILVRSGGMILASGVAALISSLGSRESRPVESLVLSACIGIAAAIVFSYLLQVNIPVLPRGMW